MLLFLNISGGEILVILVVVYLVFGPKKIPELARMLGKGINEMRRATNEIKNEINREMSSVKKDINLDIDVGDPLGIKKTVENTMNPKKDPPVAPAKEPASQQKETPPPGVAETMPHNPSPRPSAGNTEAPKKDNSL